jgi:hypothetical protein
MWRWRGNGGFIPFLIVIPLATTELLDRYVVGKISSWVYVMSPVLAGAICLGLDRYLARQAGYRPENHTLQGFGLRGWGIFYLVIAALGAWFVAYR